MFEKRKQENPALNRSVKMPSVTPTNWDDNDVNNDDDGTINFHSAGEDNGGDENGKAAAATICSSTSYAECIISDQTMKDYKINVLARNSGGKWRAVIIMLLVVIYNEAAV